MRSALRGVSRATMVGSGAILGGVSLAYTWNQLRSTKADAAKPLTASSSSTGAGKKVYISGPPGAGKGTQSELILHHYGLVHISTGDLYVSSRCSSQPHLSASAFDLANCLMHRLREEVKVGTAEGKTAKEFMDKGLLVPQSLIEPMVQRRLSAPDCAQRGFLLDGYPREVLQTQNDIVDSISDSPISVGIDLSVFQLTKYSYQLRNS
jgi:adenylate kinase family enzyme